jgi:hypothetical protein
LAHFRFEARNSQGKLEKGLIQARRIREAVAELQSQKLTILTISEAAACSCGAEPTTGPSCPQCGRSSSASGSTLILVLALIIAVILALLWAAKSGFFG